MLRREPAILVGVEARRYPWRFVLLTAMAAGCSTDGGSPGHIDAGSVDGEAAQGGRADGSAGDGKAGAAVDARAGARDASRARTDAAATGGDGAEGGGAADGSAADGGAACGAASRSCCANLECDPGLVCERGSCVSAIRPFACAGGATGAVFVSETIPPATLEPYAPLDAALTFANCTGQTWTATAPDAPTGYKLGFDAPRDYDTWGPSRLALPADVPSGMAVTIPLRGRGTPLTGKHDYRWTIVHEGVSWLGSPSPTHTIDVEATARTATLCSGVSADIGGVTSASVEIQSCIDATASGGTLELPAGVYRITTEIQLTRPITLRTAGTGNLGANCLELGGPACAILRADANLDVPRGFVRVGATTGVALDHVVLDGNRGARLQSTAAATCAGGTNGAGFNAATGGCTGCSFTRGVSARALCGTGWEWRGDQATVTHGVFRENGAHAVKNMWSDGLTMLQSSGASITGNRFLDNSDVDLIFGGGTGATVQSNVIEQREQACFAGLMLDNFNANTSGDFTGTTVSSNVVSCGTEQCDFAIELGPHPWYTSANIIGGAVTGNTATGGKFNINAEGAGTTAAPMTVSGNTVGTAPASATFLCGSRTTTAFNVSPDSHVVTGAGPAATGSISFHACP